jgi:hypothetical protein
MTVKALPSAAARYQYIQVRSDSRPRIWTARWPARYIRGVSAGDCTVAPQPRCIAAPVNDRTNSGEAMAVLAPEDP